MYNGNKTKAIVSVLTDNSKTCTTTIKREPLSVFFTDNSKTFTTEIKRKPLSVSSLTISFHNKTYKNMQFTAMEIGYVYFYTATILNWKKLLKPNKYKDIIIDSIKHLVDKRKIKVYGFVIMPNHIHLIWEMLAKNGKEMPHASLMKFTGHQFLEDLRENHPQILPFFIVDSSTRMHHFWQRNSLPFLLNNEETFVQKLNYIHNNPLQERWNLAEKPEDYRYSSAKFYLTGSDEFKFLTHWQDR